MNIAARIKTAVQESRKRATEIADECGVSRAAVSQWLKGEVKALKPDNLYALAKATNVRAEWLATGKGPMRSEAVESTAEIARDQSAPLATANGALNLGRLIEAATEGMTPAQVLQWLGLAEQVKAGTVGRFELPPDPGNQWVDAYVAVEEGVSQILASAGVPEGRVPQVGAQIIAFFDRRKSDHGPPPGKPERRSAKS